MAEKLLRDLMFDLPGTDDVASVTVNAAVVRGESSPLIRRRIEKAAA